MVNTKLFNFLGMHLQEEFTIRQLSIATKTPYMTLNREVKLLEQKKLLILKKVGKSSVCRLNMHNPLTKQFLIIASAEIIHPNLIIKKITREIREKNPNCTVVLFGSFASHTNEKH